MQKKKHGLLLIDPNLQENGVVPDVVLGPQHLMRNVDVLILVVALVLSSSHNRSPVIHPRLGAVLRLIPQRNGPT